MIYILLSLWGTWSCAYFPKLADPSLSIDLGTIPEGQYSFTKDEVDGFSAPVKYHPTVYLQKYTVMEIPLNSACMKCGICLAVAEKLEQILHFALKSAISMEDFNDYLASQLLRPICDFAFQSYGLKEWNGLRLISPYGFLDSVPNSFDGNWWHLLRDTCHFYLTHYGSGNLVKAWLLESQNVTSLLCR
ncbi:hypothetical protein RUM44_009008 [Polyplax serrata]|uniref:Uncharacterized protein n=1 Tax=Polyplax serrata TaxID=468196 RepID=A0ABR1ARG3_POLSC